MIIDKTLESKKTYIHMKQVAEHEGGLTKVLFDYVTCQRNMSIINEFKNCCMSIYGKPMEQINSEREFWNPVLEDALRNLIGEDFLEEMKLIVKQIIKRQYSLTLWRRSYHTSDFSHYVTGILSVITSSLRMECYEMTVSDLLYDSKNIIWALEDRLAYRLAKNDSSVVASVKEAIIGDNSKIHLSYLIIRAVIISENEELVQKLVDLLIAAKLQEGVRQSILECADICSQGILAKFLKVCIDENLFRFSSVIRAFATWTGLNYDNEKPDRVNKSAIIAYECLVDERKREVYVCSDNTQEAYLALWAYGCYDIENTKEIVKHLLNDDKKYRQILGWMFVSQTDNYKYKMRLAQQYLDERDEELLAWIIANLDTRYYTWGYNVNQIDYYDDDLRASKKGRSLLFSELKDIADYIGKKKSTFVGNPFNYCKITLEIEPVIDCMLSVTDIDKDIEKVNVMMSYYPYMNHLQKLSLFNRLLRPEENSEHREFLRRALSDRTLQAKEYALQKLSECHLVEADLAVMAEALKSKNSSFRKSIITTFHKLKKDDLLPLIEKMLDSKKEYQILAAIELLIDFKERQPDIVKSYQSGLKALNKNRLSMQTKILLEQVMDASDEEIVYSLKNGFGLYKPEAALLVNQPFMDDNNDFSIDEGKVTNGISLKEFASEIPDEQTYFDIINRMNAVFLRHKNYEYEIIESWNGARTKVLFGDDERYDIPVPAEYNNETKEPDINHIPFCEEFLEVLGEYGTDAKKVLAIMYVTYTGLSSYYYSSEQSDDQWKIFLKSNGLHINYFSIGVEKLAARYRRIQFFIGLLYQRINSEELFPLIFSIYVQLSKHLDDGNLSKKNLENDNEWHQWQTMFRYKLINNPELIFLRNIVNEIMLREADFEKWFSMQYQLEKKFDYYYNVRYGLQLKDYFHACDNGILNKDVLIKYLMVGKDTSSSMRVLTNPVRFADGKHILSKYDWAKPLIDSIVYRIVEVEENRGEQLTEVTMAANGIERFYGAEHFCCLLSALGNDNFSREQWFCSATTKQASLSRLLKNCYPLKNDTPKSLKIMLKQSGIDDKRLAEAVMYAPQWAGFAEEILGWKGLKSAVWFFHAHINERFSAEKETEVAIFSPITPQQFNDGAFDKHWFIEAYELLGEKRFQILYKSAKYITAGNSQHRRSQLYSDAALGKIDPQALKMEIIEKRNQEKLRCYPLIPLNPDQPQEALQRYEFIQKFLKESRQFGAQRRESEKKACNTALENLAITMGFFDVNRMIWYLESEKFVEIRPMLMPKEENGVFLWIEIDENGLAGLVVEKNGKRQKSLPKDLNKNSYVLSLKETIKELKEQQRRAKWSLERSMVESTTFGFDEIEKICSNPVLESLVTKLVWVADDHLGFIMRDNSKVSLMGLSGNLVMVDDKKLRIAHPHDLKQAGVWTDYMHVVYENKIKQPFKQVFREYYPLTQEERQEKTISRRYAGHQVQPQKTVALLKGKGWTVDYEEGLQKVFYKENLIVRMFALADWFSPADIEAPTLETVEFFDRNTGKNVDLENIPPIVFSETMRDIDLIVSVAHVGGVDPEASHSTVEMRTAIAKELVGLLHLSNVSFIGSHAKISGTLSNYSVHMGSGVIHSEGAGMVAILPVHSQARGRIFLPFVDDDPKTAEIMSKIVMLADDKKIKDPNILRQI